MKTRTFLCATRISVALVLLGCINGVQAQPAFHYTKVDFLESLPALWEAAEQQYDGDYLIYFYLKDDPVHAKMDSLFFAHEKISTILNQNYACFAVDLESPLGLRLLEIYQRNSPQINRTDRSFIVLNSQRFLVHRVMYSNGDFHESMYWTLRFFKNSGTFRADGQKYRQLKPVGWE